MKLEWEAPTHLPTSEAWVQFLAPGNLVWLIFQVWLSRMQGSGSPWQKWWNKLTAHSGRSPVYSNSVLAALMGICWDTRAETLTVTSLVTATSVCQAVGVKPGDVNLEMKIILVKTHSWGNRQPIPRHKAMALSKGNILNLEVLKISFSMLPETWEKMYIGMNHKILSSI